MKDSLKKFYEYYASDEELMTYVRLNGEWNEESFCKMRKLVREVMADYAEEDYYPKKIILYFMLMIPSIINILSQIKVCTDDKLLEGYTQESYMNMLSDKMKLLEDLRGEFINSLYDF